MTVTLTEEGMTPRQAGERLGKDEDTIRDWIRLGLRAGGGVVKLRAVRVGGTWRIAERDLEEFLAALNPGSRVELAERQERERKAAEAADARVRRKLGLPPRQK